MHRLRSFGITDFRTFDPYLLSDQPTDKVRLVSLDKLAEACDLISLHAPATPENYHLIGAEFLRKMRRSAVLVNTARGSLIDETALYQSLKSGRPGTVCLDVFETEPPGNSPLLTLPNVIATEHSAWYSEETVTAIQQGACKQAIEILTTGTASNAV